MHSPPTEPDPQRVKDLFQQALDLEPDIRAGFLERECEGDGELRRLLGELLDSAAQNDANPRWAAGAILLEAEASVPGPAPSLDRYRLISKLGAGGMGVVYRAERSDG